MKGRLSAFYLALILALAPTIAGAADSEAEKDITPVAQCEELPASVSIPVMSWSNTAIVCREMASVLEGIRRKDITNFEKAVYILHAKGYEGEYPQIAKELVEIIRLRGLYDRPDRWYDTNNLVVKSWNAFNGVIGPGQIISFLRASGPQAAKGLSDDGLLHMIILMKIQHQQGYD
jgi:hypothetical protein